MIQLVAPCRGHVTQRHGATQPHNGLPHGGQDYAYYSAGVVTDEVFAAADGVVVYAGDARDLGWPNEWYYNPDFDRTDQVDQSAGTVVVLRHRQNGITFDTTYNHLANYIVKVDQQVRARQRIATIGDTGFSAGKHLHFELLFHPFNFDTPTYGRADPNPYFVTGLSPQGDVAPATTSATTEEWDEMATEDQVKKATVEALWAVLEGPRGQKALEQAVASSLVSTRKGSGGTRSLFDQGNHMIMLLNAIAGKTGTVTASDIAAAIPAELAKQVAEELGKRLSNGDQ